ncbi:MAG: acyltransferase [Alphaproteobacteria bacterium]|nr:acyltransferase [Alphaproteobacteria bacterium]
MSGFGPTRPISRTPSTGRFSTSGPWVSSSIDYLIFPLIAWLGHKRPWLLVALALLTLLGFAAVHDVSQKTAFFLTPFRIWEFLAGSAAAKVVHRANKRLNWVGFVALLGLLGWIAAFPDTRQGGVPNTAAIVISSACVIALGLPAWINDSLPGRLLQWLGKYSYSIYLVHFPVITFWSYEPFGGTRAALAGPFDYGAVTALALLLGVLLHHAVEQPFRRPRSLRPLALGLAASALLVFATESASDALHARLMPPVQYRIAAAILDRRGWRCGIWARIVDPLAQSCRLTALPENGTRVLLVGNSHADAIKFVAAEAAAARGATLWLMAQNLALGGGISPEAVIAEAQHRRAKLIMPHANLRSVRPRAIDTLAALAAEREIEVAIIDPIPSPKVHVPKTLFATQQAGAPVPRAIGGLAGYEAESTPILIAIDRLVRRHPNLKRYPTAAIFCQPLCQVMDDEDRPLYIDIHHLTLTGAAWLSSTLTAALAQAEPQALTPPGR